MSISKIYVITRETTVMKDGDLLSEPQVLIGLGAWVNEGSAQAIVSEITAEVKKTESFKEIPSYRVQELILRG